MIPKQDKHAPAARKAAAARRRRSIISTAKAPQSVAVTMNPLPSATIAGSEECDEGSISSDSRLAEMNSGFDNSIVSRRAIEGKKASAEYVMRAVEASLSRLGTDRIDLYQLHFPDASTPITETLGALDELVTAGKVREIGCSNFTIAMLDDAWSAPQEGAASFVSVQNQMSVLERTDEAGVLLECERLGISYLPYFPLAHGLLTGKYRRGEPPPEGTRIGGNAARSAELLTDEMFDRLEALTAFAAERDHSLLDLAFAWLLAHRPVASVIAGATKPEQVAANAAAGDWDLSEDDLAEIERIA